MQSASIGRLAPHLKNRSAGPVIYIFANITQLHHLFVEIDLWA